MKNRICVAIALLLLASLGWLLRQPVSITFYGTASLRDIRSAPGQSPDLLYTYHLVESGESPYGISRRYGMSLDELYGLNGLTRHSVIHPGQLLRVYYYRHLIPQPRNGKTQDQAIGALHVLSLIISEYDNDSLTVAEGPGPKSPDFSFFHGLAPRGVPRLQAYREGYLPKQRIMGQLEAAVKASRKGDLLIVHLAGHGDLIGGQWYLLPSDYLAPNYDRLISGKGLLTILSRAEGSVLLILDSCHSGAISWDKGKLPSLKPDLAVVTSCLPLQKAEIAFDSNDRRYGLFTLSWGNSCREKAQGWPATFNLLDLVLGSQYQVDNLGKLPAQNPIIAIPPRVPIPYWN
jgi:hypothetical protein